MLKVLPVLLFLLATSSYGKLKIKEGLWKYQNKILMNGKEFNMSAQMKAMMANLDEKTKKKLEEKGLNMNSVNMNPEVCVTKEMIEKGDLLPESNSKCQYDFKTRTDKRLVANYDCKQVGKGTVDIKINSETQYSGKVKSKDPMGNDLDISFTANRLSDKCK